MENETKNYFFSKEDLEKLKIKRQQMAKIFGGNTEMEELFDSSYTRSRPSYDRAPIYSESTYVRK